MIREKSQDVSLEDSVYEEITAEGMLQTSYTWVKIETVLEPEKETEKAYYGTITVHECDEHGRCGTIYYSEKSWLPKSMATNVWWILTNIFSETNRVSNRRWDNEQYY